MNQTSPMNSGTAAGAALLLVPVISRVAQAVNIDLTPEVEGSLAVSIVAGAHWLGANVLSPLFAALMVRLSKPAAAEPAPAAPTQANPAAQ